MLDLINTIKDRNQGNFRQFTMKLFLFIYNYFLDSQKDENTFKINQPAAELTRK